MGMMGLGVSNLAWDGNIDLINLKQNNINNIEIILPKYISWEDSDLTSLNSFINSASEIGLNILSTQSIFFNSPVNSFLDKEFVSHIKKVIEICAQIKVSKLVLGAPLIRKSQVNLDLISNFRNIDDMLRQYNQTLLLEPNGKIYKGNYFYTVKEIIDFILCNKFSNIKTMIDTHNIILENQTPSQIFNENFQHIDHIHVSEFGLKDFTPSKNHTELAKAIKYSGYNGLIIYEAKPSLNFMESIKLFTQTYNI
jgi:sugar phosphate isomerase/epimerase